MAEQNVSHVAVITGGGSGIGRATALRLARRGDRIAVCDMNEAGLNETAQRIRGGGGQALTGLLDVRNGTAVKQWTSEVVKQLGRIDYLFSNAGVSDRVPVAQMKFETWNRLIDTHVTGSFHFSQAILPHMIERKGGAIVVTSSDYAVTGMRNAANYAAAKTALYALTKSLALEFAAYGIRVNAIGPGPIDTPILRSGRTQAEWEQRLREFQSQVPMQRLGTAEEVAAVVDFLLSPRASYITGQLVQPNGGQVMW